MKKEELVKKWMKETYLDEMTHYSMMEEISNEGGFCYWDKDDPRLKKFNALERRKKRKEQCVYVHFGFKKGKYWLCESSWKVERLFHNFCHEPEVLYEMMSIRAAAMFEEETPTLRSWLEEAKLTDKSIYDVPQILYDPVNGWTKYLLFVWEAYREGVIDIEQQIDEMESVKTVIKKVNDEPYTSDARVKAYALNNLKLLKWYMSTLPTSREAHEISEARRRKHFEECGIAFHKCEFNDGME